MTVVVSGPKHCEVGWWGRGQPDSQLTQQNLYLVLLRLLRLKILTYTFFPAPVLKTDFVKIVGCQTKCRPMYT